MSEDFNSAEQPKPPIYKDILTPVSEGTKELVG